MATATLPPSDTKAPEQQTPASKNRVSMRRPLVLRGYIKGTRNGPYYGICLTLNLAVRGSSFQETERKLDDLIVAYLKDAQAGGHWNDLVPRRAPFSYYWEYGLLTLRAHFKSVAEFKSFVYSAPRPAHA